MEAEVRKLKYMETEVRKVRRKATYPYSGSSHFAYLNAHKFQKCQSRVMITDKHVQTHQIGTQHAAPGIPHIWTGFSNPISLGKPMNEHLSE